MLCLYYMECCALVTWTWGLRCPWARHSWRWAALAGAPWPPSTRHSPAPLHHSAPSGHHRTNHINNNGQNENGEFKDSAQKYLTLLLISIHQRFMDIFILSNYKSFNLGFTSYGCTFTCTAHTYLHKFKLLALTYICVYYKCWYLYHHPPGQRRPGCQ